MLGYRVGPGSMVETRLISLWTWMTSANRELASTSSAFNSATVMTRAANLKVETLGFAPARAKLATTMIAMTIESQA